MATLEARGLSAAYGRAQVLFEIDVQADRGEVVALVGPNGAGKSTTLKAIMGLVPLRAGEVLFSGERIDGRRPYEIARLGLGYVPEERRIFTDLTVAENLDVGRQPARPAAPAWTLERLLEVFPGLSGLLQRSAGHLSGGEQQMLAIARTLAGNPVAILMDEPAEGLAPKVVEAVAQSILALKRAGLAVIVAEQSLRFTGRIADRSYTFEKGRIVSA